MNNINQYTILKNSINFNEHINVWFCDNQEGKLFEIITIEKNDSYQRILDRIIPLEVVPLVNRDIGGIQKILESGYSELNHCYYIVYEYPLKPRVEVMRNALHTAVHAIPKVSDSCNGHP